MACSDWPGLGQSAQVQSDTIRRPSGHTVTKKAGVFCPDRATQSQRSGKNRPVIDITLFEAGAGDVFKV
jgi:hypothetical protein